MTNLLSRFLGATGSERRRSASQLGRAGVPDSSSGSTLSLPRAPNQASSTQHQDANRPQRSRRSSRSSIHSLSSIFISALTGGQQASSNNANGRSILAKNKEDTVLVAASSPTIVQKESTESGASVALTSNGATGTSGTSSSPAIEPSTAGDPASQSLVQDGQVVAASTSAHLVEEIGVKVSGGPAAVLALAASAVASDSSGASGEPQLATVVIQFTGEQAPSQHAPLNNSSTMRANVVPNAAGTPTAAAASKRQVSHASAAQLKGEVIKLTKLLLNALNQGDYETYTRLCDPHMTSFEPENLGNLIDNMEYRRLALDQARQMQLNHIQLERQASHLSSSSSQQVAIATAAAAAAAATCAKPAAGGQSQASQQQAALAAAQAAIAGLSLSSSSNEAIAAPAARACSQRRRQYSLMLNPSVYLLGDDAASIAYQKLSQTIDLELGSLCTLERSEETRIWHRRDGNRWLCVHFHRSLVPSPGYSTGEAGPQTCASLIRSLVNQQQLADLVALAQQSQAQQAQQQSVPLISLNHSSAGSNQAASNSSR